MSVRRRNEHIAEEVVEMIFVQCTGHFLYVLSGLLSGHGVTVSLPQSINHITHKIFAINMYII